MGTWKFEVDEPLVGFCVHARPWSATAKRYVAWKGKVRLFADVAGVPEEIPAGYRATVSLDVTWAKKARIDTSNILKGIEDGLFRRDRGIGEIHATRRLHTGREAVVVTVTFERETDGCGNSGRLRLRRKSDPKQQPMDDAGRG